MRFETRRVLGEDRFYAMNEEADLGFLSWKTHHTTGEIIPTNLFVFPDFRHQGVAKAICLEFQERYCLNVIDPQTYRFDQRGHLYTGALHTEVAMNDTARWFTRFAMDGKRTERG